MDEAAIERMLRNYTIGERVKASTTIIYGTGEEIAEGSLGTVEVRRVNGTRGIVLVQWDAGPRLATSAELLDPANPS